MIGNWVLGIKNLNVTSDRTKIQTMECTSPKKKKKKAPLALPFYFFLLKNDYFKILLST